LFELHAPQFNSVVVKGETKQAKHTVSEDWTNLIWDRFNAFAERCGSMMADNHPLCRWVLVPGCLKKELKFWPRPRAMPLCQPEPDDVAQWP
jgi:hypothetical protein